MENKYRRRLSVIVVIALLLSVVPFTSFATTTKDKLNQAERDKKETQEKLENTNENIDDLKEEQNTLKGELSNLNTQLSQVSSNLSDLEGKISTKELEIEVTQKALDEAIQTEKDQYEAMKKRIQVM